MFNRLKARLKQFLGRSNKPQTKLRDLPQPFLEAFAMHNIFMAFGIPEEDIYVAYTGGKHFQVVAYQDAKNVLFDTAIKSKRLEYFVDIAELDLSKDLFKESWNKAVQIYNISTSEERVEATETTQSYSYMVTIITGMLAKGFKSNAVEAIIEKLDKEEKQGGGFN